MRDIIFHAQVAQKQILTTTDYGLNRTPVCETLKQHDALGRLPALYEPYGIPLPRSIREHHATPAGPLRILSIGRLSREQKRVHFFPVIERQLVREGVQFVWTIVGDGPDAEDLRKEFADAVAAGRVRIQGAVPYDEVPKILDASDVYLLTSDYEGLPLSLLEAMAHGLVPVVTDLASGIRDVVDDSCGARVSGSTPQTYVPPIKALADDRQMLSHKRSAATLRVREDYSLSAMGQRWVAAFADFPSTGFYPGGKVPGIQQLRTHPDWTMRPVFRPMRRVLKWLKAGLSNH